MRLNVKVKKPEQYDGDKTKDLDTWLFQVCEHLELSTVPARGHVPYVASLLHGNAALWWREVCEVNRRPATWGDFCRELREQFRPKDYGHRGRDDLATMRQYARESVADFVFRFHATCLKVPDLSEVEKLDCFVRALVQEIRLQVELRGPANFHEAAMFTERADAVITRVAGHDVHRAALQKPKWGNAQCSPAPMRGSGDIGASGSGGPEPMELGTASCKTLTCAEYEKLHGGKACFICRKPGHLAENSPTKKNKKPGNGMSS